MKASGRIRESEVRVFSASIVSGMTWTSENVVRMFFASTTPFNSFFSCVLQVLRNDANNRSRSLPDSDDDEVFVLGDFSCNHAFLIRSVLCIISKPRWICSRPNDSSDLTFPSARVAAQWTWAYGQYRSSRPVSLIIVGLNGHARLAKTSFSVADDCS